jgi:hypothetical protein
MTTPPVPSITDEQLAELESIIGAADEEYPQRAIYASLIARLRAAEADARRYRWLKENVRTEFYADQLADMFTCSSQKIDRLVDAAMERNP